MSKQFTYPRELYIWAATRAISRGWPLELWRIEEVLNEVPLTPGIRSWLSQGQWRPNTPNDVIKKAEKYIDSSLPELRWGV